MLVGFGLAVHFDRHEHPFNCGPFSAYKIRRRFMNTEAYPPMQSATRYGRFVRLSHALVAAAIVFQLASSLIMDHPHAKKPMTVDGGLYYRWHEWVGLAALAILACSWVYRVLTWKRETQGRIFPWVTAAGRSALVVETKRFLSLRWTTIPEDGALAGTVHGLGLLIASAMALTGGAIYLALGPHDIVTPAAHSIMDLHSFLSTFMWIYLCGHAAMALWHQFAGHGSFARIFRV
jgi:cytochrome b561